MFGGISRFALVACLVALLVCPICSGANSSNPDLLQAGYRQMYDLDFDGAHRDFQSWEQLQPNDPLGPASNAAAYLFSEFDRLHILESDLFVDNDRFATRDKPTPDPNIRSAFENELGRAEQMANDVLAHSPQDPNALFAKIMADGLRGDYLALIEKRNLAGLTSMKSGRVLAEKLIALDHSYYDAYVAIGIENYLLGTTSAPVRWILRLTGAQVDKKNGIANLQITAEKGRYLAPFARLLLAVAALRDRNREKARSILASLSEEFPQNHLYQEELLKIQR